MLDNLLRILWSIFFDISKEKKSNDIFQFQDLTKHFQDEISEFYIDRVFIWSKYCHIVDDLELYKYRSHRQYSSTYVDLLAKIVEESKLLSTYSAIGIVPIPMHWTRYFIRWFNHIDRLWLNLSKKLTIPYFPILGSTYSKRQSKLSKKERLINRKNSFYYKIPTILPESIILIDDIVSTGSTANACAKLLKQNWVQNVFGVFIASNQ